MSSAHSPPAPGSYVILSVAKDPELECSSNGRLPRFAKPALSKTGSAQAVGKGKPQREEGHRGLHGHTLSVFSPIEHRGAGPSMSSFPLW